MCFCVGTEGAMVPAVTGHAHLEGSTQSVLHFPHPTQLAQCEWPTALTPLCTLVAVVEGPREKPISNTTTTLPLTSLHLRIDRLPNVQCQEAVREGSVCDRDIVIGS